MDSEIVTRYAQGIWNTRYQALMLAFVAIALFLLSVLMSFDNADNARIYVANSDQISNWGGRIGAWFADAILSMLGYPAYLMPIGLAYLGWRLHKNNGFSGWNWRAMLARLSGLALTIALSGGLLSMIMQEPTAFGTAGGALGNMLARYTTQLFTPEFSSTLLLMLLLLTLSWTMRLSLVGLIENLGRWVWAPLAALMFLPLSFYRSLTAENRPSESLKRFGTISRFDPAERAKRQMAKDEDEPAMRRVITREEEPRGFLPLSMGNVQSTLKGSAAALMEKTTHVVSTKKGGKPTKKEKPMIPGVNLLSQPSQDDSTIAAIPDDAKRNKLKILLQDFGIEVDVKGASAGPLITRFELIPAPGIKASQISRLGHDLLRGLAENKIHNAAAGSIRVVEFIPGQDFVGLEIPNDNPATIHLSELLHSNEYLSSNSLLTLAIGKTINGQPFVIELDKMPHLLVAGAAGSGISMALKTMVLSMLFKASADQVQFILIDPKMEMLGYDRLPHLMMPTVTDRTQAFAALTKCHDQMQQRYQRLSKLRAPNLNELNNKIKKAIHDGKPLPDPLHQDKSADSADDNIPTLNPIPHIVLVITELSDLVTLTDEVTQNEARAMLTRIAQKGGTAGIHMIIATSQPSPDIIFGSLKSNISSRIAFQMSSAADSQSILDQAGAEALLGRGDMLFLAPGKHFPERIHGALASSDEIERVANFFKSPN